MWLDHQELKAVSVTSSMKLTTRMLQAEPDFLSVVILGAPNCQNMYVHFNFMAVLII